VAGAAAAVLGAWPAAAHAIPASSPRATVDLELTTSAPGAPAGLTYRSEIRHPTDPEGEPPVLRRLIVGAPAGAVIDTSAPEHCPASDQELRMRGDGICPRGSLLGTGFAETLVVGLGRQRFDANAFNADGQQVETVKQGDQVSAVVRGIFTPEGLDALIPTCVTGGQPPEGCPVDQARLVRSELVIPPYSRDGRSYFTTPPTCPPSGRWSTPIVMTFADGTTDRLFPEQPCDPEAGAPAGAPACRSRRQVVFSALARVGLRRISARLRGRRVRLDPRRPVLDLRGLPSGRYRVRIDAVTKRGTRVRLIRRYRTCTAK
jgi:hypothetical protein